jgi:hypothetical protein
MEPQRYRSRVEIMQQRRAADIGVKFHNRELAQLDRVKGVLDLTMGVGGVFLFIAVGFVMHTAWPPVSGALLNQGILIFVWAGTMIVVGIVSTRNRKRRYMEASDLVIRCEPIHVHLKLESAYKRGLLMTIQPIDPNALPDKKTLQPNRWSTDNRQLLVDHPELAQGAEVEMYVAPDGQPLGMFVNDRVEWFI